MTNNLYILYNSLSNRYGDVMSYPTDGFALARLSESLPKSFPGIDIFAELQLCRIGSINVETGIVTPEPAPVRVAWNFRSPIEMESE